AELIAKEFVDRPGEDHIGARIRQASIISAGRDFDIRMREDSREHRRVTLRRYRLMSVLKIAIITADANRHARTYAGIELLGHQRPLLQRVVFEHLLIDIRREL